MSNGSDFEALRQFLLRVPAIDGPIGTGVTDAGFWWAKFVIDIKHPLAWNVVQEFGHVLNYVSLNERLPAVFMPASPPPYVNGGPKDFLSWVIESNDTDFSPAQCAEWLEGRLPEPVEDMEQWNVEKDE